MHQNWSSLFTINKNVDYGDRACKFWKVQTTTVAYLDEAKSALPFGRRTDAVTHGTPDMWYCIMATLSPVYLFQHVLQRRLYSWLHRAQIPLSSTRHVGPRRASRDERVERDECVEPCFSNMADGKDCRTIISETVMSTCEAVVSSLKKDYMNVNKAYVHCFYCICVKT